MDDQPRLCAPDLPLRLDLPEPGHDPQPNAEEEDPPATPSCHEQATEGEIRLRPVVSDGETWWLSNVESAEQELGDLLWYIGPFEMPDPGKPEMPEARRLKGKLVCLAGELAREAWSLPPSREASAEQMKLWGIAVRKIADGLPKDWPDV